MSIASKFKAWLDSIKVPYTVKTHPVAYTAQELAATQHVPGKQVAKSVLVKTAQGPVLTVLPAIHLIDFKKLKSLLRTKSLSLAPEEDISRIFPDMAVGAVPPFGNLYGIPVVFDRFLESSEELLFSAGSHTDSVTMKTRDVLKFAKPTIGEFGQPLDKKQPQPKGRNAKKSSKAQKPLKSSSKAKRRGIKPSTSQLRDKTKLQGRGQRAKR